MADLAATDVTVTVIARRKTESRNMFNLKLQFGDGAKTYPAGGVPVSIGALGCPNVVESMDVFSQSTSGYGFSYDPVNKKIVMTQGASHSHVLNLKNAAVADDATTRVNAGTNLLGANTGSNIAIAGGGANGGIAATTVGAATEPSAVAIAAQTIYVEVIGW